MSIILPTDNLPITGSIFEDLDQDSVRVLNPEIKPVVDEYIDLTSDTICIGNLISTFFYNYDALLEQFAFDGDLVRPLKKQKYWEKKHPTEIAINALTINLISSAKTLLEFIRKTIQVSNASKRWPNNYSEKCLRLLKNISDRYDSNFDNRLSQQLRNFSQHGYLPVSFRYPTGEDHPKASFNLGQLLIPNFNYNDKVRKEMEEINDLIFSLGEAPHYSYIEVILSFCEDVITISDQVISVLESLNRECRKKLDILISTKPELFDRGPGIYQNLILFKKDENATSLDVFNLDQSPFKDISIWKEQIKKRSIVNERLKKKHEHSITKFTFLT